MEEGRDERINIRVVMVVLVARAADGDGCNALKIHTNNDGFHSFYAGTWSFGWVVVARFFYNCECMGIILLLLPS